MALGEVADGLRVLDVAAEVLQELEKIQIFPIYLQRYKKY